MLRDPIPAPAAPPEAPDCRAEIDSDAWDRLSGEAAQRGLSTEDLLHIAAWGWLRRDD